MKKLRMSIVPTYDVCPTCSNSRVRKSQTCYREILCIDRIICLTYHKHRCKDCKITWVNSRVRERFGFGSRYSRALKNLAIGVCMEDKGRSLSQCSAVIKRASGHRIAPTTLHDWKNGYLGR